MKFHDLDSGLSGRTLTGGGKAGVFFVPPAFESALCEDKGGDKVLSVLPNRRR